MDNNNDPNNAAQNPWIWNPGTNQAAKPSMAALITNANNPSDKNVNGNEKKLTAGFTSVLTTLITNEPASAAKILSICMPGTNKATNHKIKELINQYIIKLIMALTPYTK